MGKDWSSIRVTAQTLERLNGEIQSLLRSYTAGLIDLPNAAEGFSHDALINRLLDSVQQHRARAVRQRERRKGGEKADP